MADISSLMPAIAAVVGVAVIAAILIAIGLYVYTSLALVAIAKRTKTPNEFWAWVPVGNIYLMTQIGKVSPFFTLGILLVAIPVVGSVIFAVLMAYIWWKICEVMGRPGWWGILMVVPIANLVTLGIIAWGKQK